MAISDEIREQRKKLSGMTSKQKISYIIYYYKFHFLGALFVLTILISLIHSIVTKKEISLYCAMINSLPYDSELTVLREDFSEYAGIDLNENEVVIDCTMNINYESQDQMTYGYVQKLMALLNTGDIDVFVADKPVVDNYGQIAAFKNLEEFLPDDLRQELEGQFDIYEYTFTDEDTGETATLPIGLYIYNSKILRECYESNGMQGMYTEEMNPIFCITANGKNPENAIKFLRYLISENET